jgi:hypothetical protein
MKSTANPKRRTSSPNTKTFRFRLRPGDRLVTPTFIVTIRKRAQRSGGRRRMQSSVSTTTTVECECTKGSTTGCKAVTKTLPGGGVQIECKPKGSCTECLQTTTVSGLTGVWMA